MHQGLLCKTDRKRREAWCSIVVFCAWFAVVARSHVMLAQDSDCVTSPRKTLVASEDPRTESGTSGLVSDDSKDQRRSEQPESQEQPKQYLSFGSTQIYASPTEVWLLLDVDSHTVRGGYAEPSDLSERKEFHVYVLQKGGLRWQWKTSDLPLTAHRHFATFFRHGGGTFAYLLEQRSLYRWRANPDGTAGFVSVEDPRTVLGSHPLDTSELLVRVAKLNSASGFRKVDAGFYGYGTYPPLDYVASHVNLRLHFEQVKRGLGYCAVVAESLSSPPEWREELLRVDHSRRKNEDRRPENK